MASPETDGLVRRIAMLEAQLQALRQAIEVNASGLTIRTGGSLTFVAGGSVEITSGGATAITAGSHLSLTASAKFDVRAAAALTIAGSHSVSLSGNTISADFIGNANLKVGKTLVVEAGDRVTIKTGSADLDMKKDGTIKLDGKDIDLKASGRIDAKASGDLVMKGSKILQN